MTRLDRPVTLWAFVFPSPARGSVDVRLQTHAMVKIDARKLWQPALALVIATAFLFFLQPDSRANRLSTLDLEESGFTELYIQFLDSDRTRASIVSRAETTIRRGEIPALEPEWSMEMLEGDGWFARSSEEGVAFFVPVNDVSDWIYPFIYSFLRERRKGLELPRVEWTALYVDRLYRGLFLLVKLPFDRADAPQGRRELLAVQSGGVAQVDTWFDASTNDLDMLAGLDIDPPHASVAWLSALRSETTTLLVLSRRPLELALMPLPVSVASLYAEAYGGELVLAESEQASSWNESWRADLTESPFLDDQEREALDAEFEEYKSSFFSALRTHGDLHGVTSELLVSLPERQASGLDFGLALEGN